jgi:hypothetical protein
MQQVNATTMLPPSSLCPEVSGGPEAGRKQDAIVDTAIEPAKSSLLSRKELGLPRQMYQI